MKQTKKKSKDKSEKNELTYDEKYLLKEIEETKNALDAAYSLFENATEPDIIDCCIYQVNSVMVRYKFLLKRAKESDIRLYNLCCSQIPDRNFH